MSASSSPAAGYSGERLGLPAAGPGSVAGWGRRVAALFIDWIGSLLVAGAVLGPAVLTSGTWQSWVPLLVFFVEVSVLTALLGGSFGQLALRLAVVRVDRRPLGLARVLLRTALICLVVPPLLSDRDQRGLHDLAAGTVALRR
ncbi:MAG: RDD family protein [Nocardioidaceae bacterium]